MGTYASIIRAPSSARKVLVGKAGGEVVEVVAASICYSHKASMWGGLPKWAASLVSRMDGQWGVSRPRFAAVTQRFAADLSDLPRSKRGVIAVGCPVYEFPNRVPLITTDASGGLDGGTYIGNVIRVLGRT